MKARDSLNYLEDIIEAMGLIELFIQDVNFEEFERDQKTSFAVIRALEIIGEATKQLPASLTNEYPHVPWKQMAGMRYRLIHGYFGVDTAIVWKTVNDFVPDTKAKLQIILQVEQDA